MNILMLAEVSACRPFGGASRLLGEQASGLKQRGHSVCLLVRAPQADPEPQAVWHGIPEFRYAVRRSTAAAFVISSLLNSIRVFDRALKDSFQPEVAIIHQSLAGFGPLLFRRKHVPAWIYNCHSLVHEEYLTRHKPQAGLWPGLLYRLHAKLRFWVEGWVMRRCARVIVESRFMEERVIANHRIPRERIRLIPGGADTARFRPPASKQSTRALLRLPENRFILFTVRNLVPRMGLENLIKAVAEIEKTNPDLLLIVGGEGPLRRPLEQLIGTLKLEARVILKGFIPENELVAYYQSADLVVMPTAALEGFGLVTVEALACGTPVLGTPVGATPEILGQIDPRLLAKGNDAHSIAEALTGLLRVFRGNQEEWNSFGKKGWQLAAELYNWAKAAERLEEILRRSRS